MQRDGDALASQLEDSQMSVVMYLITIFAMSYAVWTMVQIRRIRRGDEVDESDQTAEVAADMIGEKLVPEVPSIENLNPQMPNLYAQPPMPDLNAAPAIPDFNAQVPVTNSGPPLPPEGLPPGWTEDQWQHYGEQYLSSLGNQ